MTETGAAHHAVDAVTSSSAAGAEGPTSFGIDCNPPSLIARAP